MRFEKAKLKVKKSLSVFSPNLPNLGPVESTPDFTLRFVQGATVDLTDINMMLLNERYKVMM